ncbi:MAG: FAD-dependent monooxygenase, partial [Steroidobacteraceae bacterium]
MPETAGRTATSPPAAVAETDVVIVGGGLVGASLAVGLSGTGVRVLLIESIAPDSA